MIAIRRRWKESQIILLCILAPCLSMVKTPSSFRLDELLINANQIEWNTWYCTLAHEHTHHLGSIVMARSHRFGYMCCGRIIRVPCNRIDTHRIQKHRRRLICACVLSSHTFFVWFALFARLSSFAIASTVYKASKIIDSRLGSRKGSCACAYTS